MTPLAPPAPAASDVAPVEAAPAAPAEAPSLESVLLRMRLVTPDQIASAMREEAETGRPIAEIVVANGWVSADDLARIQSGAPAPVAAVPAPVVVVEPAPEATPAAPEPSLAPAPAPVAAPAPEPVAVAAPEPVAEEVPPPVADPTPAPAEPSVVEQSTPRAGVGARVLVRLENGERIDAGHSGDFESAKQRARELTQELQQATEWPFLGGRFVRPEAIVSVDIDLTGF